MATEPSKVATVRRKASRGVGALGHAAGDEHRDDLGVGGDLGRGGQALGGPQLDVVVDVAVEGGGHVGRRRRTAAAVLLAVERVGVGLADEADAGPAGVAEHGDLGVGAGQGPAEEAVAGDGGPHGPDVVAQLADLGRRLVDEGQAGPAGSGRWIRPDGARPEQRVAGPGGDLGVGRVEPVAGDQQVQAGGVAAPHLEPVDGRQGDLDRPVGLEGGVARSRPVRRLVGVPGPGGQGGDLPGGPEAVGGDGPDGVLQADEGGVGRLQLGAGQRRRSASRSASRPAMPARASAMAASSRAASSG